MSLSGDPFRAKQQRRENMIFRFSVSILGSSICTILLVAAAYYSVQKGQFLVSTILFALVPTIIFALLFDIIQRFDDNAERYKREIDLIINSNRSIRDELLARTDEINKVVSEVGKTLNLYEPFRKLLDTNPTQGRMIRHFMRICMNDPLRIWDVSATEFHDLVIEGAKQCKTWDAIHHGRISNLGNISYSFAYLNELKEVQSTRRRIVILKPEEVSELQDDMIVSRYLIATAGTPSYWIDEDEFFRLTRITPSLRLDCTLHDKNLLLQRHHDPRHNTNVAIMSFADQNEEICDGVIKAFNELDLELRMSNVDSVKFHKIMY